MKITLQINNNGLSRGSLGWLCANIGSIKIGTTKNGLQGAWLMDRDGNKITVLAIRGWYDNGSEIVTAGRDVEYGCHALNSDMGFTAAAWEIIKQCQALAVSAMEEPAESAAEINITALKTDRCV